MDLLKESVCQFLACKESLGKPPVAAVGFTSTPDIITEFTSDYRKIAGDVSSKTPHNGTNIPNALKGCLMLMPENMESNKRIVLMSDGMTEGTMEQILDLVGRIKSEKS